MSNLPDIWQHIILYSEIQDINHILQLDRRINLMSNNIWEALGQRDFPDTRITNAETYHFYMCLYKYRGNYDDDCYDPEIPENCLPRVRQLYISDDKITQLPEYLNPPFQTLNVRGNPIDEELVIAFHKRNPHIRVIF